MPDLIDVAPGSPEWHAARREGITATDIVAIGGLSADESAYSLYHRKLGNLPAEPDNDRWRLGRELKPIIAARFCEANGIPAAHQAGARSALYRSDERPWQMATLDRLFYDEPVELKSWADADRSSWDDGPPPAVRVQALWQMDVMGVSTGHVGVLFLPSGEFRSYTVEHDESPVAEYPHDIPGPLWAGCRACVDLMSMRTVGQAFMRRMAEQDPPSPDGSAATLAALKARYAKPSNDKVAMVSRARWDDYSAARDALTNQEKHVKYLESLVREDIGDAGVIEVDGQIVARRTISPVKAHWRKEGTRDVITRVKRKGPIGE